MKNWLFGKDYYLYAPFGPGPGNRLFFDEYTSPGKGANRIVFGEDLSIARDSSIRKNAQTVAAVARGGTVVDDLTTGLYSYQTAGARNLIAHKTASEVTYELDVELRFSPERAVDQYYLKLLDYMAAIGSPIALMESIGLRTEVGARGTVANFIISLTYLRPIGGLSVVNVSGSGELGHEVVWNGSSWAMYFPSLIAPLPL